MNIGGNTYDQENGLAAHPGYVDTHIATIDLRLRKNAPALDKGAPVSNQWVPSDDFFGIQRPA